MKQEAIKVWEKHSSSLTAVLECPYSNSVFNRNRRTRNERAHINFLHVKSHYLYFFSSDVCYCSFIPYSCTYTRDRDQVTLPCGKAAAVSTFHRSLRW